MSPSEKEVFKELIEVLKFENRYFSVEMPVHDQAGGLILKAEALLSQPAAVGKEQWKPDGKVELPSGTQILGKDEIELLNYGYDAALRAQAVPEGAIDGKKLVEWLEERHSDVIGGVIGLANFIHILNSGCFSLSPEPETKDGK